MLILDWKETAISTDFCSFQKIYIYIYLYFALLIFPLFSLSVHP
jgi:hypothetical protein